MINVTAPRHYLIKCSMWHLGTWISAGLDDLGGLFQSKWFHVCFGLAVKRIQETTHILRPGPSLVFKAAFRNIKEIKRTGYSFIGAKPTSSLTCPQSLPKGRWAGALKEQANLKCCFSRTFPLILARYSWMVPQVRNALFI